MSHAISINAESLRLHIGNFVSHIQNRASIDTIRPLHVFLGLENVGASSLCVSASAFTPPVRKMDKTVGEKITSRMKLNLSYFLSNYVVMAIFIAIIIALMHPGMILLTGLVAALWTLHSFLVRNEVVLFGLSLHRLLSVRQRTYILFAVTLIVVIWKCLKPTIYFICISSSLILLHAFLRDPKHVESGHREEEHDSEGSSGSEVLVERQHRQDIV